MNNNEWLDIDVLEDYLDGKLDAKTMHRVERLSLEDPFVAEALAGLSLSPKRVQSLSLLQKQLQDRIVQKLVEQKRWQITSQRLSIAAAAAVLFVTVSLLFWMREKSNREQLVANTPKKVEVAIATKQAPEKPTITAKEVEKVIIEAKKNIYASNSKKAANEVEKLAKIIIVDSVPLQTIEIQKKNEVFDRQTSSALEGRVAGLRIRGLNSINGIVYDENKQPISGASIKLKGTSRGTVTDNKGQFSLTLDSALKDPKLNVAFLGFRPQEVDIKKDENLAIELKQNNDALSEVVIVGYGSQKKAKQMLSSASSKIASGAEPEGGWEKFEEYLLSNNKLLTDKKLTGRLVAITFEVDKEGRAIKIKAIKFPLQTKAEEKEAIRLIKEGPKWVLPENSGSASTQATVNIKF